MRNHPLLDSGSFRNVFMNTVASLASDGVDFEVVMPYIASEVTGLHTVGLLNRFPRSSDYPLYFARLLMHSREFLSSNRDCIIHHFLASYRGLDALDLNALAGQTKGHAFILGPAETPHTFLEDDTNLFFGKGVMSSNARHRTITGLYDHFLVPVLKALFLAAADKSERLIVVSEKAKALYSAFVAPKKITVIPYGVDLARFSPSPIPDTTDVLFVGNLVRRKSVDILIQSVQKARIQCPSIRLHIVGDGPQKKELLELVARQGMEKVVFFHGRVSLEKLPQFYRACRVFCQPSVAEGWCHTALEAMASGRPVILTDTPGSPMIKDGITGLIVSPRDIENLSRQILTVMSDYETASKMGRNARNLVEKEYDWRHVSRQYLRIYQSLV